MHVLALLGAMFVSGTITVHVRQADEGLTGVYVQRAVHARVDVSRGILSFEGPAQYSVRTTQPSCTGHYGNAKIPVEATINLSSEMQKDFQAVLMPGQLLGGGEGSGMMCGTGFGMTLQPGLVAAPMLPRGGGATHWKFDLHNVKDQQGYYIADWAVDLTFTTH